MDIDKEYLIGDGIHGKFLIPFLSDTFKVRDIPLNPFSPTDHYKPRVKLIDFEGEVWMGNHFYPIVAYALCHPYAYDGGIIKFGGDREIPLTLFRGLPDGREEVYSNFYIERLRLFAKGDGIVGFSASGVSNRVDSVDIGQELPSPTGFAIAGHNVAVFNGAQADAKNQIYPASFELTINNNFSNINDDSVAGALEVRGELGIDVYSEFEAFKKFLPDTNSNFIRLRSAQEDVFPLLAKFGKGDGSFSLFLPKCVLNAFMKIDGYDVEHSSNKKNMDVFQLSFTALYDDKFGTGYFEFHGGEEG